MLALRDLPGGHGLRAARGARRAAGVSGGGPRVAVAIAWLVLALVAYLLVASLAGRAVERLIPGDGWPDLVTLLGPP